MEGKYFLKKQEIDNLFVSNFYKISQNLFQNYDKKMKYIVFIDGNSEDL